MTMQVKLMGEAANYAQRCPILLVEETQRAAIASPAVPL
jgi:hypothetical protein